MTKSLFFSLAALLTVGCADKQTIDTGEAAPPGIDQDGDGFTAEDGDCDDLDNSISPGADELCDGIDNDCDGTIDEEVKDDFYADADGDGFGSEESVEACEVPDGYSVVAGDCDDAEAESFPGNVEYCDGIDNNCDGVVDEGVSSTWYADLDGDGYGDDGTAVDACEAPEGYISEAGDCNDADAAFNPDAEEICSDPTDYNCDGVTEYADADGDGFAACEECDDTNSSVHPDALEVCDDLDNDCDGSVDEDTSDGANIWYEDFDGDGFGEASRTTIGCERPSGYVADSTDCDDTDAAVNPLAIEVCDDIDNDCDSTIDESDAADASTWYADTDSDGYGDPATAVVSCEQPSGYVADSADCDDGDAAQYPGADEYCNGEDDNCDGTVDEDSALDASTWYADDDGDTYGDAADTTQSCSQPSGYVSDDQDCDDGNNTQYPGADEYCNGEDDDCDGDTDESGALDELTWYADTDADSYGDPSATRDACDQPSGFVSDSADCDDGDAAQYPGADEYCNGEDDNCDGTVDEDSALDATTWYGDSDGDTYGSTSFSLTQCSQPSGYVVSDEDCDDTDAAVNPSATEVCDGIDNDCNGDTDDSDSGLDSSTATWWYTDDDGDGYGDVDATLLCDQPSSTVTNSDDCDDADAAVNPAATEVCDGIDNDCDSDIDDADSSVDLSTGSTWYADTDADTYGDAAATRDACDQPSGFVSDSADCDDGDAAQYPGADEYCNGEDDDCDGATDEDSALDVLTWYADSDGDTYGDAASTDIDCSQPSGYVADDTDCDDSAAAVNPSATEVCDGIDNDCDADIDDADASLDASTGTVFYADTDGDSYGDISATTQTCDQPSGYVTDDRDCDDGDSAINPSATEVCDGIDNDCDGDIDDDDSNVDQTTGATWYADTDGDSFGDVSSTYDACDQPSGFVSDSADCDDGDASQYPGADEYCNGEDDDCDGATDEDSALDVLTWYADSDGDSYGDAASTDIDCSQPSGYVADDTDCDDGAAAVNPSATEVCDGIDNDCDADIDDADASLDASTGTVFYADTDGDSYGDISATTQTCDQPSGYVTDDQDCDDGDSAINPAATEVCDGIDNDCDSLVDDDDPDTDTTTGATYYADVDSDGYGDASSTVDSCGVPSGYVVDATDCDDADTAVNPAATEVCDSIDNDCDTLVDDADSSLDASTGTVFYADSDSDGYGDISATTQTCLQPSGYLTDDTDCDDGDAAQYPGADEYCNGEDDDCDGTTDEEALDGSDFYVDDDGDGFGDPNNTEWACDGVTNDYDCNDADSGEPVYVDVSSGSASGDGSLDSPYDTIQAGIDDAGECVIVEGGTYYEAIDFDGHNITVTGVEGAASTIIDASGLGSPVATFANGEQATLQGFTLTGGDGYVESSASSYACTSITTCTDYYDTYAGGGVYIDGADPFLVDLIIEANSLPVASTTVSGNDTFYVNSYGGGVYVANGTASISGSEISTNDADQGGGVYVDPFSVVEVESTWLVENIGTDGGGFEVDGGELMLLNVAMMWNTATSDGGGTLLIDGVLDATNITQGGDDAPTGGGIYASGTSTVDLINAIIAEAGTGAGVLVGGSASFSGSYNDVYGNVGGNYSGITDPTGSSGNISSDPLFASWTDDGNPANDDMSLSSSSPAIDAGDPSSAYDDADGTTNDMGAWGGPGSGW